MQSQDDKLRLFTEAINGYAEKQRLRILHDVDSQTNSELEKAEKEALREAYNHIQKETAQVRASVVRELSAKELDGRRKLFELRQDIEKDVFAEASESLRDFTKTAAYDEYLERALAAAVRRLTDTAARRIGEDKAGPVVAATVFRLREADLFKSGIFTRAVEGCRVEQDNSILLGGFNAVNEELCVCVDMTLDARLEQQYEPFRSMADLSVTTDGI